MPSPHWSFISFSTPSYCQDSSLVSSLNGACASNSTAVAIDVVLSNSSSSTKDCIVQYTRGLFHTEGTMCTSESVVLKNITCDCGCPSSCSTNCLLTFASSQTISHLIVIRNIIDRDTLLSSLYTATCHDNDLSLPKETMCCQTNLPSEWSSYPLKGVL